MRTFEGNKILFKSLDCSLLESAFDLLLQVQKETDSMLFKIDAGDALDGLNGWLYWLTEQACARA